MAKVSLTPAQVTAFIKQQREAIGKTAASAQRKVASVAAAPAKAVDDQLAAPQLQALFVAPPRGPRNGDLERVDAAMARLGLDELLHWNTGPGQSLLQLQDHLSNSEDALRDQLESQERHEGVQLSEPTRTALAELLFAEDKPGLLRLLLTDDYEVQDFVAQLRAAGHPAELSSPEEARDYLVAARQHASEALERTLPLLAALPAEEKRAVQKVLGEDGRFFDSVSPAAAARVLDAVRVE